MKKICLSVLIFVCIGCDSDGDQTDGAPSRCDGVTTTCIENINTEVPNLEETLRPVSCQQFEDPCVEISSGDSEALLEEANLAEDGTTIVLQAGTWRLNNQVTFREATGVTLIGQGIDHSILNFSDEEVQTNGVDAIGDNFRIEGLTIEDAKKDALRIEDSTNVTIRAVKVTWTGGAVSENGAYGLYPVRCVNVLIEDTQSFNAADAGLYVGQSQNVIVRNNIAMRNVAGIEIENTQYADVYGNLAEDNTAGILVFDLPGNKIVGRDVRIHNNMIRNNNRGNFAGGGTVSVVPAGVGSLTFASRRVEFFNNTYENNNTTDLAILNGLAIRGNPDRWAISNDEVFGDLTGLELDEGDGVIYNYRSTDIYVHGNTHENTGTAPDDGDPAGREIGWIVALLFGDEPISEVFYDGWGESGFSPTDPGEVTNDHHICLQNNTGADLVNCNLEEIGTRLYTEEFVPSLEDVHIFAEGNLGPYDCAGIRGDSVEPVTLENLP